MLNVNVLNVNIAQLPWPIGIGKRKQRVLLLIRTILELDTSPDILCFQEAFNRSSRKLLSHHLRFAYPYSFVDNSIGKFLVGVNSGLAIFSKFPIIHRELHTYTVYRGVENFAKKGVMGVRIEIDHHNSRNVWQNLKLSVFTTHLQAGGFDKTPCICKYFDKNNMTSSEIKESQVMEAARFINHITDDNEDDGIVLCGDFNLEPDVDFLGHILEQLSNLSDSFDATKSKLDTTVIGEDKRIDYQFTDVPNSESVIIPEIAGNITDHYAVSGIVPLQK